MRDRKREQSQRETERERVVYRGGIMIPQEHIVLYYKAIGLTVREIQFEIL